jgi:hypothetical protein
MQAYITDVIKAAENWSLVTLYEAKLALNMPQSTTTSDDQLELLIKWASEEIALMCNRNFARETVTERFDDMAGISPPRLYLSYAPVRQITTVTDNGTLLLTTDYRVDIKNGIVYMNGGWSGPAEITYEGGYDLPFDAPKGLGQAAMLLMKEAYYSNIRGDTTIRSISHKESRVMYFDPNAANKGGGGGSGAGGIAAPGSTARKAVDRLLQKYTRFYI